jgi:hypothetical protein
MKRVMFLTLCCVVAFFACDEKDPVSPVALSVEIVLPEGISAPESYDVKIVNFNDNTELPRTAGSDGKLTVDVLPGIYTITVSAEVLHQNSLLLLTGTLTNINIIAAGTQTVTLQASAPGTLIMKELYYCGSKTETGGNYFRDQFYELYNNGESVIYLDGLCFGTIFSNLASTNQPTWDIANQEKYIFYQWIWQLPGAGTDYPLQPGESIIIAQWATNHKVEALNPNSPVNLASAEFEGFCPNATIQSDEQAINMELVFRTTSMASMPQWLSSINGCAYAMFFPDENTDLETLTTQVGSSTQSLAVPISIVADAVELVLNETQVQLKRVPTVLDAGATFVGESYVSKSVSRKVKETKDGRNIYKDTNNSTEDFEVNDTPVVRRNGAKIPSWNTWAN